MHTINDLVLYRDHILYTPSKTVTTASNSMTTGARVFKRLLVLSVTFVALFSVLQVKRLMIYTL